MFTGVNTYTGTTTINSGATLALAGSGTIATSSGVIANGTFDVSQTTGSSLVTLSGGGAVFLGGQPLTLPAASGTFSGAISDGGIGGGIGGRLVIAGGSEVLAGANTYSGGTTINQGATLQIGAGGTTGSIAGNVTDNGILTFAHSDNVTYAG